MGYQQPYYVQIQKPPSNGLAITSMILGIVAVVIGVWALIPFLGIFAAVTGFFPAVIAVILGHIGMTRARQMGGTGRGQVMAGHRYWIHHSRDHHRYNRVLDRHIARCRSLLGRNVRVSGQPPVSPVPRTGLGLKSGRVRGAVEKVAHASLAGDRWTRPGLAKRPEPGERSLPVKSLAAARGDGCSLCGRRGTIHLPTIISRTPTSRPITRPIASSITSRDMALTVAQA